MANVLCVALAATFLMWPAFLNGFPLVFSDTGGFLEQALMPDIGWDKPWIYGPFLTPFHWRISLWPAAYTQALILSASLWIVQVALRPPSRPLHLILCAILAIGAAAPWFASLIMPDIFAPICVLALFTLAAAPQPRLPPPAQAWVAVVATVAIAVHLAHLILAAACIATLTLLRRRILWRPTLPLVAALAVIVLTNAIGHGKLAVSPYGADFALARLIADGPARDYLQRVCPQAGYRLCAWKGRLPTDSDDFLWDPNGPVWANGYGPTRLAPEAAQIVAATIAAEPFAVLKAAIANMARQLVLTKVGDVLTPDYLDIAVLERLRTYFPPAEANRLIASRQYNGTLAAEAESFAVLHACVLVLGAVANAATIILCWRRQRPIANLAVLTLVALLANAFSTGALSRPHHRYQARIAWLVLLPPFFALTAARKLTSSPNDLMPTGTSAR